jgi:hypothetical protein
MAEGGRSHYPGKEVTLQKGVPGDAVPWPEREVSSLPLLLSRPPPQAAPKEKLNSYEKSRIVSEEQNQQEQPEKKENIAKKQVAQEQSLGPRNSYWPFALAVALSFLLFGFVLHPALAGTVILVIGLLLTAGSIIGWGLERR